MTFTSDLSWNLHIDNITSVALRKLFFLRRCLCLAPKHTRLLAYTTFVRSVLEYANIIWFPHTSTNISKLEKVQRKAVRFIFSKYRPYDSPTNLLADAGLKTLSVRARQARLKFIYQLMHGSYKIDQAKYVTLSTSRLSRNKHPFTLNQYSVRNDMFKFALFPRAIKEWNLLNSDIVSSPSLSSFINLLETSNTEDAT